MSGSHNSKVTRQRIICGPKKQAFWPRINNQHATKEKSLKKSQICLLLQQKYNKTVQVQVTIIPRQPGKELSVTVNDKGKLFLVGQYLQQEFRSAHDT